MYMWQFHICFFTLKRPLRFCRSYEVSTLCISQPQICARLMCRFVYVLLTHFSMSYARISVGIMCVCWYVLAAGVDDHTEGLGNWLR